MNISMALWLQGGFSASLLFSTLAYSLILVAVINAAFAYRRLSSTVRPIPEFCHVNRMNRCLCIFSKLFTALHPHAEQQSHQVPATQTRLLEDNSLKKLVNNVVSIADTFNLDKLEAVLAAWVEEGFQESARVEAMCNRGLADSLDSILSRLTRLLSGEQASGNADPSGKALGAACLQVSWLLVQLASGSMETRRALARGITAAKVAAFMGSVAPVELLAPVSGSHLAPPAFARLSADSIDLRASSSGQGPPESGNTNYRSPPAGSITNNHIILQQQQQQIRSLLMPGSLVDAVLRNCSWCLLMLCDVGGPRSAAAPPQDGHSDTSSAPAVEMGDMKLGDVELALVYSRELLRKPHSAPLSTSGGDSSDGLPADVLARIVQSWDGLEASVTAAAVLACITCLVDLDAELAQRASNLLLASPTFGNMCEALCRAGAADESVLTSTSGPVGISERAVSGTGTGANLYGIFGMAATAAPHVVPSRCLTRACAVLSQFLSRTLSQPQSAGFLLRQAVADHAVGWLLHASTLPLALRQQLLRQLLGTEGHGAISPPAAQLVDAPLALCHIISAPPACHSLLAPDVAGYLLAAAPFGSSTVQPPSQPGALPAFGAVADGHLGQQQQQNVNNQAPFMIGDDDAWEPDAALLGAQALGGPQPVDVLMDIQGDDLWVGGDAPGNMAADVFLGVGAAIAAPPDGLAVDLHIPAGAHTATAAEVERHVSTLAVACRLLLASCRLENAFRAFLSDLCATGRVALKRRSLRNCAPIDMGYARRGSLDGRLLELEPSMTHHGTATAPWSSNDSSSGGGRFGGGSGTVRESGASFLLPSSSSNGLSRGGAAAWSLPMSGNCAGDVGGEGIGASGSTWPEARSTLDQAGVEGTRGSWCWHSVDAAMMGAAPAGCSGGGSSHSAVCAGSGAGAASVATAAIASFPAAEGCSQPATYACRRSAYALDPRADLSREAPGSSGGGTVNGSDKAFHGAALSGSLRLQSPIVALTDVMAGVAGLIDAMLWRSPSLGGERCHRGGFMDHYDSMSESDSTMYANHERHSTDGGGARGSAGLLQVPADVERTAWRAAAPWSVGAISSGRIRLSLSAGEFDPCGTNARAVGPQDIDAGKGSCHFGDSQSRIRSSGQVAYSTERSDSGSRLCRQNKLLQGPNSHAAAAVGALRLRQGSSSTADRAASYDLGGGAITENVEDEQGEQPQRLEMQQQEMQLFEKDGSCTHLESATAHVAVATWLGLPAPDRNTQRLRPECVYGATPVSPERLDAESGSSSVLYRRTNMMECVESGDRGSCDNCYSMPQPSFSKHAFCEITNAPATDDAEDDVARASEAGIRGAYGAMESEFPTMTNPSSWLLSAGMPRLSHMAMDNGSDNLTNYDITSRSDPRRSAVGQSRCSGRHGEGAMSAAKSMSAAAPTLSSSLTCEHERTSTGSSNASQLPPYTYFGSTQLTAEALALPEDVATMVTSMLSATGGSSNSTAGRIAIAAAAAAAAAATASSAGAAGATTAATTLAASAASAKPVARLGKGTAAPMNTSGEGHWSAHLHNACGFASRGESESDTQFAVDTGVADGNDEDTGINPPVPEGSPCLNGNGNGHVRPDRQGSHAFSWRRFPAFHTRIWRGFTASRATAADSSAPAPSSAVMAQCDVGGIGDSHGACDGMQEASPCRSAMVDLTSSGIDCVVTGPHAGPTAYLDRTFDAATRPPVMAGPSALLPMPVNSQAEASVRQVVPMEMAIAGGDAMVIPEATAPFPWVEDNSFEAHGVKGCITRENVGAAAGLECPFAAQETCDPISSGRPGTGSQAHPVLPMPVSATAAAAAMPGDDTRIPGVPLAALRSTVGLVAEDKVAVFAFGNEQVEVPSRALRTLRRCSPLLYSWLSRLPDFTKPITILQVPGLDDSSNCRVFLQLLAWAQGIRDVEQLLLPLQQPSQQQQQQLLSPPQQQQQCKGSLPCDAAVSPASAVSPSNVTNTDWPLVMSHEGGVEPLEQLWQLWRAADYLQVDELLTAVEDELARRFTLPPPNGPAAWAAALSLAGSQQHFLGATSRLAKLCALHFMRGVWGILGDEELLIAAGVGAGVLGPAVAAEVRDRLVALVALADLDMSGGE